VRALLDVNVIIALLDPDHAFHERAHLWWAANRRRGWASCPLTENGVVRIMSHPGYSQIMRFTPGDLIRRLRQFAAQSDHEFWPDGISLRDENIFEADRIHSSRQLTDLYLLAMAVVHQGRLVTFDQGIPISGVRNAKSANLCAA
jgi:toxin-antitoxin system PIN domain toxin